MPEIEDYDVLVIGSGEAGKYLAWAMASEGHRTAVVERKLVGGSCPNMSCLPSKNIIYSAEVRSLAGRAAESGVDARPTATSMKGVQDRKRAMVDGLRRLHLDRYRASGAELILGHAHFPAPRAVDMTLADGEACRISGDRDRSSQAAKTPASQRRSWTCSATRTSTSCSGPGLPALRGSMGTRSGRCRRLQAHPAGPGLLRGPDPVKII